MFFKKKTAFYPDSTITFPDLIGKDVLLKKSTLSGRIQVGDGCRINEAFLSGEVIIGAHSSLWGPGVDIYSLLNPVRIGKFCSIARYVSIQEYNHKTDHLSTYFIHQNIFGESMKNDVTSKGSITIGHDVWIGAQSVILSGVTIGSGSIIAANSVVNTDVPPYSIVAGTPAKVIRKRFDPKIIDELMRIQWWNWDIEKIKRNKKLFEDPITLERLQKIAD
jgi:acetyltransferase-like isoleucine patch superfamily enzyme